MRVNGRVVTQLGTRVSHADTVAFDDTVVRPVSDLYVAVNKPAGFVCSNVRQDGRPIVVDLFGDAFSCRLFHVGRLDCFSTGLIFYTNDGVFASIVAHPSSGVEKEYLVTTGTAIQEALLRQYLQGIRIDSETYTLSGYRLMDANRVLLTLREGKNREIRKVFGAAGCRINRIHRTRIGTVTTQKLPPGGFRFLNDREIDWFRRRSTPTERHE